MIEIADHRNPRRSRRPHREGHARHAPHVAHVRPEFFVHAMIVTLVEQVDVLLAQGWEKAIGIEKLVDLAARKRRAQLVAKHPRPLGDEYLENSQGVETRHDDRRRPGRFEIHHFKAFRSADQRTHHHAFAAAVRERVHAEHRVRRRVTGFKQSGEVAGFENHDSPKSAATMPLTPARSADTLT